MMAPASAEPLLVRRNDGPPRRNLVFTSAGDKANLHRWLGGRRNFDLWISYYGDEPGRYSDVADFYNARRDAKFGNLKFVYDTWPHLLARYEAILVTDDDVLISAEQMSRLFELRDERDLWLLQAAFSPLGKISWDITRARRECSVRFTNFVEMTCPLFRKDKLDAFMAVFDPVLKGDGTDYWFMQSLGDDLEGNVAIVDAITCINPHDRTKGGVRECDLLQSAADRQAIWEIVRTKYGIARHPHREFSRLPKAVPARWLSPIVHWPIDVYASTRHSVALAVRALAARLRHDSANRTAR